MLHVLGASFDEDKVRNNLGDNLAVHVLSPIRQPQKSYTTKGARGERGEEDASHDTAGDEQAGPFLIVQRPVRS